MKLYTARFAPNPRRVMMFLAEKGITDIEIIQVDLIAGEHRTPEFREKSPLAQLPVLELDDGRVLTESKAICNYLEAVYPEPNLLGAEAFERAEIEMWDRRAEILLAMPLMLWVRHASPMLAGVEKDQSAEVAAFNQKTAMRTARFFDKRLAEHPFIAGDRFTIADMTALAGMDFAKMLKWRPAEDTPHLAAWRARMAERPCGQTAP